MLWDKGIREFCEAAHALRRAGVSARFELIGGLDPSNPASVSEGWLIDIGLKGDVQWLGHREDMIEVLQATDIVCLPSYREGLPKILLEAAACECALVATDVPGCREVVRHGETGLLTPPRDAKGLADAVRTLLFDAALRTRLGKAARALVESELSIVHVQRRSLALYADLLR
jgi:glycosyltransferase involved in cell wall biosynthesis